MGRTQICATCRYVLVPLVMYFTYNLHIIYIYRSLTFQIQSNHRADYDGFMWYVILVYIHKNTHYNNILVVVQSVHIYTILTGFVSVWSRFFCTCVQVPAHQIQNIKKPVRVCVYAKNLTENHNIHTIWNPQIVRYVS